MWERKGRGGKAGGDGKQRKINADNQDEREGENGNGQGWREKVWLVLKPRTEMNETNIVSSYRIQDVRGINGLKVLSFSRLSLKWTQREQWEDNDLKHQWNVIMKLFSLPLNSSQEQLWGLVREDRTFLNGTISNHEKPHACHFPQFLQHCCDVTQITVQHNLVCMNFSSLLINILMNESHFSLKYRHIKASPMLK